VSYTDFPVEKVGGLNLAADPAELGWSGAVDCLNIDFDQVGRVRARDGYAKFTTSAAASAYLTAAPFYTSTGTKQLISLFGGASGKIDAISTAGAVVASQAKASQTYLSVVRFGAPGTEYAYVSASTGAAASGTVYRWDGAAWTTPAWTGATPVGILLGVQPNDNRLVLAGQAADKAARVNFSDAGVPTTWGANNFVDLVPGDGEQITGVQAWRDLLFVFKESKFFLFYGNSTDSSGNPVFNYKTIAGQGLVASAYRALTTSQNGVYFLNRRGIWLTTSGQPQLISRAIDPIFRGNVSSFFASSALNQAQISLCALHWHDERLYFAYPSGSATSNDRVAVWDSTSDKWTIWDLPAADLDSLRISNNEELVFPYATGTADIGRHSSSYTQDGGNGTSTGAGIVSLPLGLLGPRPARREVSAAD
jgi:hypothetical protein